MLHVGPGPVYLDDLGVEWSFSNPYCPVRTKRPGDRYIPTPSRPRPELPVSEEQASAELLRRLTEAIDGDLPTAW
jgi:hypothetical protein